MMKKDEKNKNGINKKMVIMIAVIVIIVIAIILIFSLKNGGKKKDIELGNLSNMGLAASGDEGVFYNKFEEGIVKVKGMEEFQITDETAYSITLLDDDIYYMTVGNGNKVYVKKIKTNGNEITQIKQINTSINKMYLYNSLIFYATNDDGYGIAKMNLDGTENRTIISSEIADFEVIDGKIYYTNKIGNLYVATIAGTDSTKINPEDVSIREFQVKNDWIYYFNDYENKLYKMKTDGTKNQLFSQAVNSNVFNLSKDKIYFFDANERCIASVDYNGEKYKKIVDISTNRTKINVVKDIIYYLDASQEKSKIYQMYRVKTDGGKAKTIEY